MSIVLKKVNLNPYLHTYNVITMNKISNVMYSPFFEYVPAVLCEMVRICVTDDYQRVINSACWI